MVAVSDVTVSVVESAGAFIALTQREVAAQYNSFPPGTVDCGHDQLEAVL